MEESPQMERLNFLQEINWDILGKLRTRRLGFLNMVLKHYYKLRIWYSLFHPCDFVNKVALPLSVVN